MALSSINGVGAHTARAPLRRCAWAHSPPAANHPKIVTIRALYRDPMPLKVQFVHAQFASQISIPVPSYTGTMVLRSRCVLGLPQHVQRGRSSSQVLTPRTPRAVGPPLVLDPDQVRKHTSLVPRSRVRLADKWHTGPH